MAAPMTRAQAIATLTAPGMPYALEDAVIGDRQVRIFTNAPPSLRAMYEETATDQPFLVYEDQRWTFAQAWADASRIGHVLVHQYGVRPGDRVAIAMRNYPEWVLSFCAITSIGAIAVAINGHWQSDELAYGLKDSGAQVVLADRERLQRLQAPVVQSTLPQLQCIAVHCDSLPPTVASLEALTAATGPVPMPAADIAPEDNATILYTSGSTGHPKGVISTHRNIISALLSWELDGLIADAESGVAAPVVSSPGTLLAVPLFHVSGLHGSYLAGYRAQRRMVAMYRWDAELAAQLIEREKLNSLAAPAAMTGDLLRIAQEKRHDLSSLTWLGGGGAPRAPEQVRQIAASFDNALPATGWGMTETNAIGVGISGEDYLRRPASSGRCSQVLELKIINELGEAVPVGERGELLVRGTSVFNGYWQRPEVNAQSFLPGGWFRTGDVAYLDEEGYLFIVDRIKDLIIRGGENIGCGQVEAALLQHPDVHEASVYAVPDERLGEEVGATVHANPGLDVEELKKFLSQHLARFEVPRYIRLSPEPLPRTPSGKILKREIRQSALAELETERSPSTTSNM